MNRIKNRQSGSKLHALPTLRVGVDLRSSRQHMDCVQLAAALEIAVRTDSVQALDNDPDPRC